MVLVETLRRHLEGASPESGGWLAALGDRHLSRAVAAVHEDPARAWTVEALAARAGLSRTAFAVRFRRVTGQTPMGYLTRWRMRLAADRLSRTDASVARVAEAVGYASESAFAIAFKRATGRPPRRYAREARSARSGPGERDGRGRATDRTPGRADDPVTPPATRRGAGPATTPARSAGAPARDPRTAPTRGSDGRRPS